MTYLIRRIAFLLVSLWVAVTLNFFIPRMMPGNPAENLITRFQGRIDPMTLHALEIQFGISQRPLWEQYLEYLWNMLHGQLGISLTYYPVKVTTVIATSLPWTLGLVGITTVIAFVLGTLMGIYGSWHRGGVVDSIQSTVFTFMSAVPAFWLGLIFLWYFGLVRGWFPLNHAYADADVPAWKLSFILDVLHHAALPAFSMLITSLGGWMLGMRNNMIQTLGEDYVTFAEAKGVPEGRLMVTYAARNALLPSVTGFGMALASVVGGSILIETLFSYPGLGYQLSQAVSNQDYPLMQGLFLMISAAMLFANFLVDLVYGRLDPRVRRGGARA
ncbi:MAG: ABC transporter permease [Alicyclobacillus sp.]|nr:ABC transporter permease [Alicyclobacillus sp.]